MRIDNRAVVVRRPLDWLASLTAASSLELKLLFRSDSGVGDKCGAFVTVILQMELKTIFNVGQAASDQ